MLKWRWRASVFSLMVVLGVAVTASAQSRVVLYSVRPGDSLGRIARRHDVTIEAICRANLRSREQKLFPGDRLIIPAAAGSVQRVRSAPATADVSRQAPRAEPQSIDLPSSIWQRYARQPRTPGYVVMEGHGRRYAGHVLVSGGAVSNETRAAFSRVLFDHHTGQQADLAGRLVQLLVQVSDAFGGRTVHITSGFRESSHAPGSRHPLGAACDFSIEGVPNLALFAFLSALPHVGVGYYPNSTLVHLDVRAKKSIWVDLSEPGEPSRYVEPFAYFKTRGWGDERLDEGVQTNEF